MKSYNVTRPMTTEGGLELAEELRRRGVLTEQIDRILASGYYVLPSSVFDTNGTQPYVEDSFYGPKVFMGRTPIDEFLKPTISLSSLPVYTVGSLADIEAVLADERHARFRRTGRLSFRGQSKEYSTRRPYPNPMLAAADGAERMIIPSFWRRFRDDWSKRFDAVEPESIFTSMYGDALIYHGIPDWQTLGQRNAARYGIHTMSDLEEFPDPASQEYLRRWRAFKLGGASNVELPLVEQHYGIDTCGLDITFDVCVAAFFAAYRFILREDGTAHYIPPAPGGHTGVLYGFVFTAPPLRREEELIREISVFDHIPPIRPIRQQCALPFFRALNFNEAACDLDFVMYLAPNFDLTGLPDQRHLFPVPADDPFYDAALKVRRMASDHSPYRSFVDYRFE